MTWAINPQQREFVTRAEFTELTIIYREHYQGLKAKYIVLFSLFMNVPSVSLHLNILALLVTFPLHSEDEGVSHSSLLLAQC